MSFEFDNSKNKNHLLQSLIQELKYNQTNYNHNMMTTNIMDAFKSTDLIFNFDLDTQLKFSKVYDKTIMINKMLYDSKKVNPVKYPDFNKEFLKDMSDLIDKLESIT